MSYCVTSGLLVVERSTGHMNSSLAALKRNRIYVRLTNKDITIILNGFP